MGFFENLVAGMYQLPAEYKMFSLLILALLYYLRGINTNVKKLCKDIQNIGINFNSLQLHVAEDFVAKKDCADIREGCRTFMREAISDKKAVK